MNDLVNAVPGCDLSGAFCRAVAVSGAVISTLGLPLGSETVCASDRVAARVDEIQIDLGEGPCWDSLRTRRSVLERDLRNGGENWPAAREAFRGLGIRGIFAFPLFVGNLNVGTVGLYTDEPRRLTTENVRDVRVLAAVVSRHLLWCALRRVDDVEDGWDDGPYSRGNIHRAAGMLASQLHVRVDEGLSVLCGRAHSTGRPVCEVAEEVISERRPSPADI
ncbi:GAF domain-containing protein [Microbacterium sp. P01]|uniref:GAF domain-containing protein n=1 Tax=Microbacterium sp. P01 TaxID=3366261 RepID=UPI00366BA2A4